MDAITRAYEICAPYTDCTVTISLFSGTHNMLRTLYGYYLPSKSDKNHQTTKLIINTENGLPVTINYKLADKYRFLVGAGLTFQNIYFDAIDSTIHPDLDTNGCLS